VSAVGDIELPPVPRARDDLVFTRPDEFVVLVDVEGSAQQAFTGRSPLMCTVVRQRVEFPVRVEDGYLPPRDLDDDALAVADVLGCDDVV